MDGFKFDMKCKFPSSNGKSQEPITKKNWFVYQKYIYGDRAKDQIISLKVIRRNHG